MVKQLKQASYSTDLAKTIVCNFDSR